MTEKVKGCPEGFVHIPAGNWTVPVYRLPVQIGTENEIVHVGFYENQPDYINLSFYLNEFCISETETTNTAYHAVLQNAGEAVRRRYDFVALYCDGKRATLFSRPDKESLFHFNTPFQLDKTLPADEICGVQINEATEPASSKVSGGDNPLTAGYDAPNQPVVNVNWYEAEVYCEKIGGHLPSSAQWFRAAEGIPYFHPLVQDRYDNFKVVAQTDVVRAFANIPAKNQSAKEKRPTVPVKSYAPSPLGIFDMVGNAAEWCRDDVNLRVAIETYPEKLVDRYEKVETIEGRGRVFNQYGPNPKAFEKWMPQDPVYRDNQTFFKAVRGGSWHSWDELAKVMHETPNTADLAIGFRCVLPVQEKELPIAPLAAKKRK